VKYNTGMLAMMALGLGLSKVEEVQPLGKSNEWIPWLWLLSAAVCWQGHVLTSIFIKRIIDPIIQLIM
jgi:hypothetical protein